MQIEFEKEGEVYRLTINVARVIVIMAILIGIGLLMGHACSS